ncbi:MAG: hypothetical protein RMJ66_03175 [Bacteroidia bacterium]|nr:hypothetical protein [Bacteroidia bacterium]MDW8134047.1 hypothetical protein [Bacteroidia bacterium]
MPPSLNRERFSNLKIPLVGENLPAGNLPELLEKVPYLWLQFLRHLGCIYCKGLVEEIRNFLDRWTGKTKPTLIFVHPNTLEEGREFFAKFYPNAAHIADPELRLYRLFEVKRLFLPFQVSLRDVLRFWKLWQKGLRNEKPSGDALVLHASFLFYKGELVWSYYAKRLSDVPDWRRIP